MSEKHRDDALVAAVEERNGVQQAVLLALYCCHRSYRVSRGVETQSVRGTKPVDHLQLALLESSLCELSEALVWCNEVAQSRWRELVAAGMAEPVVESWNGRFSGTAHEVVMQWSAHIIRAIATEIALQERADFEVPVERGEVVQSSFLIVNESDLGLQAEPLSHAYRDPLEHVFPEGHIHGRLQQNGSHRLMTRGVSCTPGKWRHLWALVERQAFHTAHGAESVQAGRMLILEAGSGPYLTVTQATERYLVTRDALYAAIRNGEIQSHRHPDAPKKSRHLISEVDLASRYPRQD